MKDIIERLKDQAADMIEENAQAAIDKVQRIESERRASKYMFYCFCAITLMVGLGVTLCQLTP